MKAITESSLKKPILVLHLEDNDQDRELLESVLLADGLVCDFVPATNRHEFEAALNQRTFDLILSDFALPSYDGMSALAAARKTQEQVPFIFVSGTIGEELAVESLKNGATDYVLKDRRTRLVSAVRRALREAQERVDRKRLEDQLRQSQKMEAMGQLAGGIAHDLNNALTPIVIGTQLLRGTTDIAGRDELLDMIAASANRGAAMVKHILGFVRGAKSGRQQVPLSHLVKEMVKIIQDTFPKSILVTTKVKKDLWDVSGDTTELYQVLLNLCVNARDAMPQGGELTLGLTNVSLSEEMKSISTDIPPGGYLVLSVTDTGTGIPPDVLPRIFEPLFSTKAPDKGTGLGLSTVAGIVKNHNGFIQLHSEIDKGTEFKIYLPANQSVEVNKSKEPEKALPVGHGELILIMDDEATVRQLARTTLQSYGYRVITAVSGLDGITTFGEFKQEIKLLVSDTDMPLLDGIAAVRAIQKLKPEIPVIMTSGNRRDKDQLEGVDTTHLAILEKPYTVEQLLNAVAQGISLSSQSAGQN
jgi:two-component system cell cycle sensor histidine kinase/response regulator CckA